ncbi:hypothetical protein [Nonomuraea sp. GTA35]|uniref:hypothetical protein n=1 Tax=Nonomuraea sp. GTA35 TaxID=1676746 RepID=UPI0035C22347
MFGGKNVFAERDDAEMAAWQSESSGKRGAVGMLCVRLGWEVLMATRAELMDALRRAQELSDQHWHCLDRPLQQMSGGRTWTGPVAELFAGDLVRQRAELWRGLRGIIDHLHEEISQATVMRPGD